MKERDEAKKRLIAAIITASLTCTPFALITAKTIEIHNQSLADRAASLEKDAQFDSCWKMIYPYNFMCWDDKRRAQEELAEIRKQLEQLSTPTPVSK